MWDWVDTSFHRLLDRYTHSSLQNCLYNDTKNTACWEENCFFVSYDTIMVIFGNVQKVVVNSNSWVLFCCEILVYLSSILRFHCIDFCISSKFGKLLYKSFHTSVIIQCCSYVLACYCKRIIKQKKLFSALFLTCFSDRRFLSTMREVMLWVRCVRMCMTAVSLKCYEITAWI